MTSIGERKIERIENMCGGKGYVIIEHLLRDNEVSKKCKLYAEVTIEKDCELGYHEHHGETETYYITQGKGIYNDNGRNVNVTVGDVLFCKNGCGHGLINDGDEAIKMIALIIED